MAKIKDFEYPHLTFTDAIRMIRSFQEKLKGNASNVDALANAMGHKSGTSGPFRTKTADLGKYGLLEGRGEFKTTDLAKQILFYHNKEEYQNAIKSVVDKIDLFKKIYEAKGKDVTDPSDFKIILTHITHADRQDIEDKSEEIRNIYIDLISNLDANTPSQNESNQQSQPKRKEDLPSNMISASSGNVYIEMPKDKRYIKIVESLLSNLKAQIELEGPEETKKD